VSQELHSLEPVEGRARDLRRRLNRRDELLLVLLPTATVLVVLGLVEALSEQRLLFASLVSSAFLIYLDPQHGMNTVRALALSQLGAAVLGWMTYGLLGSGYLSGGVAMVTTIALMIVLDAMHPPAVATAMSFALRAGDVDNLLLFALSLGITTMLAALQKTAVWLVARQALRRRAPPPPPP
jgi:CBS-domain-containing membrane protein